MSDWVSTEAGRHLRGRSSRNTLPEITLRKALHASGFRFRLHRSLGRGCNPDLVLPKYRVACWVDGCWWHGHGHQGVPKDGPNAMLWAEKLAQNKERDARAVLTAEELGWTPIRLWECEIRADVQAAVGKVRAVCHTA